MGFGSFWGTGWGAAFCAGAWVGAGAAIAQDLGLHPATVDRYAQTYHAQTYHAQTYHAQTYHAQGLSGYLQAEQPGYWGLLTSAQLARLYQELDRTLYTDCRQLVDWLATTRPAGCRTQYRA